MLCLQTSCHRCPSALHNRLVTSTPSLSPLSLIHHVRVDASSITEAPGLARGVARTAAVAGKTLAWPLAGRGGGMRVEERRVVDHGGSGARGDGAMAWSRADRRHAKTNLPHWYAVAARKHYFVSLNYPQKKTPLHKA